MDAHRKLCLKFSVFLLLLLASANLVHAQNIQFCKANLDTIVLKTGMAARRDKLLDIRVGQVSDWLKEHQPQTMYNPPRFSKDGDDAQRYAEMMAIFNAEYKQLEDNAVFDLEKYAQKLTDSLVKDIRLQIELVAINRGCTAVLGDEGLLYGGESITEIVTRQTLCNPSICARWRLPMPPQQRAIFFFFPIFPLASIFLR